jgi:hypothetical protein
MDALDVSFKVTAWVAPARFESVRAIKPNIPAILNCTRAPDFVTHFGTARVDSLLCNRCGVETKKQNRRHQERQKSFHDCPFFT